MERRGVVSLFSAVCGFGLLLKASFAVFILFPFLYVWIKSRSRGHALLFASLPCLILALPWYAFHLRSTVQYAFAAGYGKSAAVYGTGAIFSFHAIATYLSNVVREGISGYYASLAILLGGWTMWRRRTHIRPLDPSQKATRRLMLFWLLPFVVYLFGQNKDVRFIAPILPALALLLASVLDSTFPHNSTADTGV